MTAPPVPEGTSAAFATMVPSESFRVDTPGCSPPVFHSDKKPKPAGGTTVAFNEYALEVAGAPQPASITIDYPADKSIFPPEITPPTFLWRRAWP